MFATRFSAGVLAGLVAGLVFGVLMHVTMVTTPAGERVPMLMLVAQIVGSPSLAVGWVYHLFNSAVFGAIFGLITGPRTVASAPVSLGAGAAYGVGLWIVGGLVLMPLFLGMPVLAPLLMPAMQPMAVMSLVGHLLYGVVLGAVYPALIARMVTPRI